MNKQAGFSLLEVIVAFSILAISLSILLNIFSAGVRTAGIAEEYIIATQLAESLMTKTGIESPLIVGESTGIIADKYHWLIKITPFIEQQTVLSKLFQVQVTVYWQAGRLTRQIELNTFKQGN